MEKRIYEVMSKDGSISIGLFDATDSYLSNEAVEKEIELNWEDENHLSGFHIDRFYATQVLVDY